MPISSCSDLQGLVSSLSFLQRGQSGTATARRGHRLQAGLACDNSRFCTLSTVQYQCPYLPPTTCCMVCKPLPSITVPSPLQILSTTRIFDGKCFVTRTLYTSVRRESCLRPTSTLRSWCSPRPMPYSTRRSTPKCQDLWH